jgi:hypothetical protein
MCPTEILSEILVFQVLTGTVRYFCPVLTKTKIAVQDFVKFFSVEFYENSIDSCRFIAYRRAHSFSKRKQLRLFQPYLFPCLFYHFLLNFALSLALLAL